VVRFEFPYMARARLTGRRAGPDRLPKLLEAFREQVALEAGERPLLIGGKSMGGRVASLLLDELAAGGVVRGGLCLGYPFHPPGKPQQLRTEHLRTLQTPALILQGERDPFGRRGEVEGYALSPRLQIQWLPHGDHSFTPTRSSGLGEAANWILAVQHADRFCRDLLRI
jgi:predicted alpha/beta-hydrolase family hydrolase